MCVYHGEIQSRADFACKEDTFVYLFGPIERDHNIGIQKELNKGKFLSFIRTCRGLYYPFLRYHKWNYKFLKKFGHLSDDSDASDASFVSDFL
jgi:hypothetical protein